MKWHRTELRLPMDLHQAMTENARLSGRTLNAQINFILSWWLTASDAERVRVEQELGWQVDSDEHANAL